MKRILKIVGVVVLVAVVGIVAVLAATFMGRRGIVDGQDLGNGVRIVADGFSGIAIVPTGERQVLLVDAGQDSGGEAIVRELVRTGLGPESVAAVLVTHGHADHTGALPRFPNAEVMALEREVPVVEGREGTNGPVTRWFPFQPNGVRVRGLRDGETVQVGDASVRVFAVPGHTAGSAAYLVRDLLFVGDSADVSNEGAIVGAPWIFSDSQDENVASLRRLAERLAAEQITVRAIVPAHSGPVEGMAPLAAFAAGVQSPASR